MVATTASCPIHLSAAINNDTPMPNRKTVDTPTSNRIKASPMVTFVHVSVDWSDLSGRRAGLANADELKKEKLRVS